VRILDRTKRTALAFGVASLIVGGIGAVGLAGLANGALTGVSLNVGDTLAVTCSGKNLTVTRLSPTQVRLACHAKSRH
jgi:threonine dehydratase